MDTESGTLMTEETAVDPEAAPVAEAEPEVKPVVDGEVIRRTLVRELTLTLTDEQIAEKGRSAADLEKQITEAEIEFESVKKQHKGKIEKLSSQMRNMLSEIRGGKETKQVECEEVRDYASARVEYRMNGVQVEERAMEGDELQQDLFLRGKGDAPQPKTEFDPIDPTLPISEATNPEQDLKDAIREETNPATKHSMVDGPVS